MYVCKNQIIGQARQIVVQCGEMLRVGVTTDQIDQLVFDMAMAHNAYPSPLNYKGFPKSVCTSVNNVSEPMTFSKISHVFDLLLAMKFAGCVSWYPRRSTPCR